MPAPKEILDLVARFELHMEAYKAGHYNETQLRRDYLDPFFKALGWDIDNTAGHAEAYRDVIHEDAIRIGGTLKAPDYCFRVGGTRKFFLEAKKPKIVIKDDIVPAYQLRRYAWTAKLPLSILSDFEEFAIYDCRPRPAKTDKASSARIFYCTFRELPEKWDYIASIFSKDAVLRGSFDKFAAENKVKRGTAEVDAAFLEEIERWRKELAQNLALRNAALTQRELNFAVQRIIDRIIFLRIAEDRGLEEYGRLAKLTERPAIYSQLCKLFEAADARYNSGLFHFKKEKDRHEDPDELTLDLDIDDKLLKDILKNLYYPDSPYEFSILSADILGQVYEQFLGKVITLSDGHRAKIEDKPEVKKAGGVYYTPTYIVDYIVRETVGKLIADIQSTGRSRGDETQAASGKSESPHVDSYAKNDPRRATAILDRVAKLRILDPACGSGSFLIGAYQHLLDWHLDFYLKNDPARWAKEITRAKKGGIKLDKARHPVLSQSKSGAWQLSIAERKRILLDNIYGVDLDSQAVEVTKLSLLLKVLEGEAGLAQMTLGLSDRVLPDLGDNIKCGNSLIGPDFYHQADLPALTDEERYRINVFDWPKEFPEIFRRSRGDETQTDSVREDRDSSRRLLRDQGDAGGFDAVIGNPPYVRIQGFAEAQIAYFGQRYSSAVGNFDLYIPFIEKGYKLLNRQGRLGMIVPNKFLKTDYGEGLRGLLSKSGAVSSVVDFGASQVFKATTYTCLLFLARTKQELVQITQTDAERHTLLSAKFRSLPASGLTSEPWNLDDQAAIDLSKKLEIGSVRLLDLPADMSRGSSTGDDEVFVVSAFENQLEEGILRVPLFATDFEKYSLEPSKEWRVIFPYDVSSKGATAISEERLKGSFPETYEYLRSHRPALEARKQFKDWYGFSAPRNLVLHAHAQIAVPLLAEKGSFAWIPDGLREKLCPMASGGFTIAIGSSARVSPQYVLGILNSKLLFWRLRQLSNLFRGGWITCTKQYFGELPIHVPSKATHDRIVQLVERMLDLHRQRAAARTPQEQTALDRQIQSTDAQIDRLVYELYSLTEDEIRLVEGTAANPAETGHNSAD